MRYSKYTEFQCKLNIYDSPNLDMGEVKSYLSSRNDIKRLKLDSYIMKRGRVHKCVSSTVNIYLDDLDKFLNVKLRRFITWDRLKYNKYKSISSVVNRISDLSVFNMAAIMRIDCDLYYRTTINNRQVYRVIQYRWRKHSIHIKDIMPNEFFSA